MELNQEIRNEYPFQSHFLFLGTNQLHYVDEGRGEVLLMIHGNPTWSFYYRHLIKELSQTHRVIALDHMGCGLSDKPQDYNYTLEQRIDDVETLITSLEIREFSLVVHDWGGAIGFGLAVRKPELVKKIVILNTAAFTSTRIPFSINLCKGRPFGPWMVKYLNAFCYPATFMTTTKKLKKSTKKAYLLPYQGPKNRVAISEFVQDIPLDHTHKSYSTLLEIENKLPGLKADKLILWGGKDFCFNDHFYNRWREIYPEASFKYYPDAGHYILEDETEDTLKQIEEFLTQ